MENKKMLTYLIVIGIGIILGIIASIIHNYVWYIILFSYILGACAGKIYDIVLRKNEFNSEDKKFIYGGVLVFVITMLFSVNTYDYYQNKSMFNDTFGKEYKTILNDSIVEVNNIYEKLKAIPDIKDPGNILSDVSKSIESKEYEKAVDSEILFFKKFEEENGKFEEFSGAYETLDILKDNFSFSVNDDYYNTFLKKVTGYDGYTGNWIFSVLNSGTVITKSNEEVDTGFIGSIIIYIIDIVALLFGVIFTLSILKTTICKLHKKIYVAFGETYDFPTILKSFKGLEIDKVLENMNTLPEKKGFFSNPQTFYCNINFSKCEDCNLLDKNTIIQINFNHYGASKSKPLTGMVTTSFILPLEEYNSIVEKLKAMTVINV